MHSIPAFPAEVWDHIADFVQDDADSPATLYRVGFQLSRTPSQAARSFRADRLWAAWAPAEDLLEVGGGEGAKHFGWGSQLSTAFHERHCKRDQKARKTLSALWHGKHFVKAAERLQWAFGRSDYPAGRASLQQDRRFGRVRKMAQAYGDDRDILHALGRQVPAVVCALPEPFQNNLSLMAAAIGCDFRAFKVGSPSLRGCAPLMQLALRNVEQQLSQGWRERRGPELAVMWQAADPSLHNLAYLRHRYEVASAASALRNRIELTQLQQTPGASRYQLRLLSMLAPMSSHALRKGFQHMEFFEWAALHEPEDAGFILSRATPSITASAERWLWVTYRFVAAKGQNYAFIVDSAARSHPVVCVAAMQTAPHLFLTLPWQVREHSTVAEAALRRNLLNWPFLSEAMRRDPRLKPCERAYRFLESLHARGLLHSLDPQEPSWALWATGAAAAFLAQTETPGDETTIST